MSRFRLQLDLQMFAQEKTEPATPKKRQDARKKGQVAKSAELPGAFILFFCFLAFIVFGSSMKDRYVRLMTSAFHDYMLTEVTIANVVSLFGILCQEGLYLIAPVFAVAFLTALLGNYLQIGVLFTGDPLVPKFSKINPLQGFKKLFGLRSVIEMLKSVLKITVIGAVVYTTLWGKKDQILLLSQMPLQETFRFVADLTVQLGIKIGIILIALALFDYLYQKYDFEKNLRMSKQDIKDEYKKSEGDPLIKGKIKERQRKLAMQRMMQDVPKADVIITNPTHFAVAIQYQKGMAAPKVIAKGTDYVAQKIKEIGRENGVVLMENRPLARALYDQVEIGGMIPADLFQAVAEVLAYVYKIKGKAN